MMYEIHIGEMFDIEKDIHVPKQKIIITEDQFKAIEPFAFIERDADLTPIYILNKCRFKILPNFEINK